MSILSTEDNMPDTTGATTALTELDSHPGKLGDVATYAIPERSVRCDPARFQEQ